MRDVPSTYFIQDKRNKSEIARLVIQDQMITHAMGGVLPEQTDPTVFRRVLDVGCGTGGWVIEAAKTYPTMSLVGIDISQRMIKYAQAQAEAHHVDDRVEFYIMDVLGKLDFPAAFFDLVNLRFGTSFVRTWDWPRLLRELLRVTTPGGVVRITDSGLVPQCNSFALVRLCKNLQGAFFRAGHLFERENTGVIDHLPQMLNEVGCQPVRTKAYATEYRAGTAEGEAYCEDIMLAFRIVRPFIDKWEGTPRDYEVIYRQARDEMRQPDFLATLNLLTTWGCRP